MEARVGKTHSGFDVSPVPMVPPSPPPSPSPVLVDLTTTASVDEGTGDFLVTTEAPEGLENIAVTVDGEQVVQLYDTFATPKWRGHTWTFSGSTSSLRLHRDLLVVEPGSAIVGIGVRPTRDPNATTYDFKNVTVEGEQYPFVLPMVTTGRPNFADRIPRSMFYGTYGYLSPYPGMIEAHHEAGITHLEASMGAKPVRANGATNLAQYRAFAEVKLLPTLEAGLNAGFRHVGLLDDWFDSVDDTYPLNLSWAEDLVRYTAATMAEYRIDCTRIKDEVVGPQSYPNVENFVTWWREEGGPPLGWPDIAIANAPHPWDVDTLSDYTAIYVHEKLLQMGPLPKNKFNKWLIYANIATKDTEYTRLTVPAGGIVGCNGALYTKFSPGAEYNPEAGDYSDTEGSDPQITITQTWLWLAYGISAFWIYAYDRLWYYSRLNAPFGVKSQTGSMPGDSRWDGVRWAFKSVAAYERQLLAQHYQPVRSGGFLYGRRGDLVFGINITERSLPVAPGCPAGVVITTSGMAESGTVPSGGVVLWAWNGTSLVAASVDNQ